MEAPVQQSRYTVTKRLAEKAYDSMIAGLESITKAANPRNTILSTKYQSQYNALLDTDLHWVDVYWYKCPCSNEHPHPVPEGATEPVIRFPK